VTCRACHRGRTAADFERFDAGSVGCRGCHEHKNVHPKEKYTDSQCLGCHQGAGKVDLKPGTVDTFHGPKSAFPLIKGHKPVKCAQCHPKDTFKDTPAECGVRCHEDSLHKGSLGDECSRCHLPGVWDAVRFDHADDTKWPLEGCTPRSPTARTVTRPGSTPARPRPARPTAATPRTTSTRAGWAPAASAATRSPATTSSTTTRCRRSR
jgi:hypothetical protein